MAPSTRTVGIVFSTVIAIGLVAAAFVFSSPHGIQTVGATSSEELLRAYAATDTDGDGLYDWLEELCGADPLNPHSLDSLLTDREAVDQGKVAPRFSSEEPVETISGEDILEALPGKNPLPGSLTERFAREFFEDYLSGEGTWQVPTDDDLVAFVERRLDAVENEHSVNRGYSRNSLSIVPGGADALRSYAAAAEMAFAAHTVAVEKSDVEYFADAVYGDANALAMVSRYSTAYEGTASALARIAIPEEAAAAHLDAVNAMAQMGALLSDMARYDDDPLLALVALRQYESVVMQMADSLMTLYGVFSDASIDLDEADPGYSFYSLLEASAH